MITLSTSGFDQLLSRTKNAPKQIKFAVSKTLNDAAKASQKDTVEKLLPEKFTLRSKGRPWQQPGGPLGFNIRPFASPSQAEPATVLGTRADFMLLQETGGKKKSTSGKALSIAVPGTVARPSESSVVSARFKPRNLLKTGDTNEGRTRRKARAKTYFVIKFRGGGRSAVFQRFGRGPKDILPIWFFIQFGEVREHLTFVSRASKVAVAYVNAHFSANLKQTLATAR